MSRSHWDLKLFGGFSLLSPTGEPAVLPTRKAQAVLAILALEPSRSASRQSLQTQLWGEVSSEKQQASLRQALAHLRKVLGHDAILSTREGCQLSPDFSLRCDARELEEAAARQTLPRPEAPEQEFMPEFREPWFEQRRNRYEAMFGLPASPSIQPRQQAMPLEGLLSLLRWYVEREPPKALHLLRDHRDLVMGISPKELQPIADGAIRGVSPSDPMLGWGLFWRGFCVLIARDVSAGESILQRAMQLAVDNGDQQLQIEAGIYLASCQIVKGQLMTADQTTSMVRQVARRTSSKLLKARANLISGSLALHQGQVNKAIDLVKQSADGMDPASSDAAHTESLLGLYLATSGRISEASEVLLRPENHARQTGHLSVDLAVKLARSLMALKENELDLATALLEDLIARCTLSQATHLEIYAREALALAAFRRSERGVAANQLRTSGKLRRSLHMGITDWDISRLGELAAPMSQI